MARISLLFSFSLFLFPLLQYANSTRSSSVPTDLSSRNHLDEIVNDFASSRLNSTRFCRSILLPNEFTLKESLEATLANGKRGTFLDDEYRMDLCCRSLHKCDALKNTELNHSNKWNSSTVRHCECLQSFSMCLEKLNTSLSNDFASIHNKSTDKCYDQHLQILDFTSSKGKNRNCINIYNWLLISNAIENSYSAVSVFDILSAFELISRHVSVCVSFGLRRANQNLKN